MTIFGTPGNDDLTGTAADEVFDMTQGGRDTVHALGGNDLLDFGTTFTGVDVADGGKGFDGLALSGNYDIHFTPTNLVDIDIIYPDEAFTYAFTFDDANVAAGKRMIIEAGGFDGANFLTVDASDESDGGWFDLGGSSSADILTTGNGNDIINSGGGDDIVNPGTGKDTITCLAGDDLIIFEGDGALDVSDRVDGGGGLEENVVRLDGDYSGGLTLKSQTLVNIAIIELVADNDYTLNVRNGAPTAGLFLQVKGDTLGAGDQMNVSGKGAGGSFALTGGAGKDTLTGGDNFDRLTGGGAADKLTGNGGTNLYEYHDVADSIGKKYDTVVEFDADKDYFDVRFPADGEFSHVTAVDTPVSGGGLSDTSFNNDLATAIGAAQLGVANAVIFTPNTGTLAGEVFLIVDANGQAGYQGNQDLVIHLQNAKHIDNFDLDNFNLPN